MDDLELAVAAATAGGAVIAAAFGRGGGVEMKGRNDPVTATDRASEEAVVGLIRRHRPDDTFLAEEGGGSFGSGRHWIVDPLDGTVNFVHGIPQVSVSVALYEGPRAVVGVVFDPLRDELFAAAAGGGATLHGSSMRVSAVPDLAGSVVATGFPYDHDRYADEYTRVLSAVLTEVNGIRRFGSAALDLAWVAAGRYEAYWELGVAPWDHAAGTLLVREAGGIVTDPWGTAAVPRTRLIVAANAAVHPGLMEIVERTMPDRLR